MYARYVYKAGATPANILADLCALLCGTTDKATLSADCVQEDTEISSIYNPATWVMHDNAAPTAGKVLKQRAADNSCDKFLHLAVTATQIKSNISETWNATTHTGTGLPSGTFASVVRGTLSTSSGVILIYTDPYAVTLTTKTTSWGNTFLLCAEFTRNGVNSALTAGYPNFATDYGSSLLRRPRSKSLSGTGDATGLLTALMSPGAGNNDPFYISSHPTVGELNIIPSYSLKDFPLFGVINAMQAADFVGFCPSLLKIVNSAAGSPLDEAVLDSILFVKATANSQLFPSYVAYLLPKG